MSIEILNSITCIVLHSEPIEWTTISSWYLGSSNPLYFDMLCRHSKPHRFKLIVESDLSEASLHVINLNPLLIISMTYIFKVTGVVIRTFPTYEVYCPRLCRGFAAAYPNKGIRIEGTFLNFILNI